MSHARRYRLGGPIVLLALLWGCGGYRTDPAEFPRRREELERIVGLARSEHVAPGTSQLYRLHDGALEPFPPFPPTPATFPDPGYTDAVEVAVRPDGARFVLIVTRDRHHAGMFGYVYTSRPPDSAELGPFNGGSRTLYFRPFESREWFVDRRLEPRWWAVYNDLD